jgi:hypothetical protein
MMLDATQQYQQPLSEDRLFSWHAALFPTGRSGMHKIAGGAWRDNKKDDPMQVVSGAIGKEKVHFEAPEAARLNTEMNQFRWLFYLILWPQHVTVKRNRIFTYSSIGSWAANWVLEISLLRRSWPAMSVQPWEKGFCFFNSVSIGVRL